MKFLTTIFFCLMVALSSLAFASQGASEMDDVDQASMTFRNYLQASLIFQNYLNNKGDSSQLASLYVMYENGLPAPNRMTFYDVGSTDDEVLLMGSGTVLKRIRHGEFSELVDNAASPFTAQQLRDNLFLVFNAELVAKSELTADAIADAMFGNFGGEQVRRNILNFANVIVGEYGAFVATQEAPYFFLPDGSIVRLADLGARDLFSDVNEWMDHFRVPQS